MKLGPLEIGAGSPPRIRVAEEDPAPRERCLFLSDLHLSARRRSLVATWLDAVRRNVPDWVLLGGDLVDRRGGLEVLEALVRGCRDRARVAAIPGNHDALVGGPAVRDAVRRGGGHWLPDADVPLAENWVLTARLDRAEGAGRTLLLLHDPGHFPRARAAGHRLVLAGHLHGGQVVLFHRGERTWPGALVSRWNGPRFVRGAATLLVGNGLADSLPLRFNCPREMVLLPGRS